MPNTPLTQSMMDLLSHISLPAANAPSHGHGDASQTDPRTPLPDNLAGPHGVLDHLLAEVEHDLLEGRQHAATTALGLAGTRVSLDAARGHTPPKHVEWLAAHLRAAAREMGDGHPGKALKAVRLARLALRP
ncbi:hypothetical protein J5Y09_19610 [Roseomonas sp. PWR1]|uniref:DUF222 domain-containing protein n=1 Tax=Roseomonas nitratireducens TaxID=2820810 RepID=A0ABS4AXN7_9PROT|nr:hypothetical protein [Neoroseomonas nitratireducens]MBP0466143.1 hypothetical protein [Neoroseomonas nitratireducens]